MSALLGAMALAACGAASALVEIPLSGPAARPASELSSLAWHGDQLFLAPENAREGFFVLDRAAIAAVVEGKSSAPLTPAQVPITNPEVLRAVPSFDGIEAIAFDGDRLWLVVESRDTCEMAAYLLSGALDPAANAITLDPAPPRKLELCAQVCNLSVESIVLWQDGLLLLAEANGKNLCAAPTVQHFGLDGTPRAPLALPNLEYRVTDAGSADAEGRFWVLNYLWPPERSLLQPADEGADAATPVEQLLELRIEGDSIRRTDTPPIDLRAGRPAHTEPHNWEGLVPFDERGFLIVTDAFPRTTFAFVPNPSPTR